uniref:JmjC domain-containing protein n=1 Tax=Arcella intermedia TaxID=1963864 RepID=A0A6B2L6F9_9EUKA
MWGLSVVVLCWSGIVCEGSDIDPGHFTTVHQKDQELLRLQNQVSQLYTALWASRDQIRELRSDLEKLYLNANDRKLERSFVAIDRRANLDVNTFFNEYAFKGKPVIITDYQPILSKKTKWDLKHFEALCGSEYVTPLRYDPTAKVWGRLVETESCTLRDYLQYYSHHDSYGTDTAPTDFLYLHDWHLPIYCPEALTDFIVPKYFSGDLLQRIPKEMDGEPLSYVDEWPSLFVGPKNSQSAMHVDSFGSNFWMYLIEGRKKWNIFSKSDLSYLYEDRATKTFEYDPFNYNLLKTPLAAKATVYECILEPGEILFVPAVSPHAVFNLEDSIAMSMNYVDASNYNLVIEELSRLERTGDQISGFIAKALRALSSKESQYQDLSWSDFKKRGR